MWTGWKYGRIWLADSAALKRRVISRGKKSDPCLTTFARLLEVRDFPLLERLQQEPILGEEELYYLGFSLAEGDSAGQGLGGDILMAIAEAGSTDGEAIRGEPEPPAWIVAANKAPAPNDNMEVSNDEIARLLRHIVGVQ